MTAEETVRTLPIWRGAIALEPLIGGLSNSAFKVTDDSGTYVARVGADFPFHQVSRAREAIAARAAFVCGLSPDTVYAQDGVSVVRFLVAKTLSEEDVRRDWRRCLALVQRCHSDMAQHITGQGAIFWVFQIIRDYARSIAWAGHPMARHLSDWIQAAEELERAQVPMPIVFGHHDLLAANFLDDGKRLWLVDWEYGAFGTPMFDLANLVANNDLNEDDVADMLGTYFGREPDAELQRGFDAMVLASGLRELMWAVVSDIHLKAPGVNYQDYAQKQLARFEAARLNYKKKYGTT